MKVAIIRLTTCFAIYMLGLAICDYWLELTGIRMLLAGIFTGILMTSLDSSIRDVLGNRQP